MLSLWLLRADWWKWKLEFNQELKSKFFFKNGLLGWLGCVESECIPKNLKEPLLWISSISRIFFSWSISPGLWNMYLPPKWGEDSSSIIVAKRSWKENILAADRNARKCRLQRNKRKLSRKNPECWMRRNKSTTFWHKSDDCVSAAFKALFQISNMETMFGRYNGVIVGEYFVRTDITFNKY